MDAQAKQVAVRQAVFEVVAYFAVFGVPVSLERINKLLPVKANHLAVVEAVKLLVNDKKLQRIGDEYGLASQIYRGIEAKRFRRDQALRRARRWGRAIGALPFVKSVVVINSVATGNVHSGSDIDLLVMTTPGRIFIARQLIEPTMKLFRRLASEEDRAGKFVPRMFLTVRGVPFERDIMRHIEPHLANWLLLAEPVYGARRWAEVLRASRYVQAAVPNMLWPRGGRTIDRWSWRWLDARDDQGYRSYLKHASQQAATRKPEAFVRIRPDIINEHEHDRSGDIAERWRALKDLT